MTVSNEISALCAIMRTTPMYICDVFGVSPSLVEQLLVHRGQMRVGDGEGDGEEESIRDAVERHYGKAAVALIERNI